jgi:hypothetical protein
MEDLMGANIGCQGCQILFGITYQNLGKYAKIWENIPKFGKIYQNLGKYTKILWIKAY